jgi:hypothetical protein
MSKVLSIIITVTLVLGGAARPGMAQIRLDEVKKASESRQDKGPALRLGYGFDPSGFVAGLRFAANSKGAPRVVPSLDFGFGSDIKTTIAFSLDFLWRLRVEGSKRVLIGGIGPTVAYINPAGSGSTTWGFGLSVVAGIRLTSNKKRPINLMARISSGDVPDSRLILEISP